MDDASKQVTVNLTRVPSSGVLKVIALDAGESIPSNVFDYDYSGALYTGYFYSADLKTGNNTLALSAAPAAGKVLYAVAREYASGGTNDYVSEGIPVTSAVVPFAMYIKGQLTNESTSVSFVPKMKRYNDTARTLRSAVLYRAGAEEPIAQVQSPAMGEAMTFSGLSGLTAGEKLKLVVLYDDDKTAEWEYVVCDASETDSFEIVEKSFTTSSTTITVKVSGYSWYTNRGDWSRICISTGSASQTQPGDDEGREDLTSQIFTGKGTYTFTIPTNKLDELKEGNSIMAALRFYDGNGIEGIEDHEYYAAADSVLISKATVSKTPLERLANCSVTMMKNGKPRTENFRQEKTTVDYAVTLDDEISSATLGFYAYPGTVAFDPDGNHKLNLGSVTVTKSGSGSLSLDLTKVPVGYRVIASLYVCIDGDDWYRHVNSVQMPEVVDENGNGFQDYAYPDATIDETELQAGATSLHVSVTGDERFFQYAKAGKISIYLAIAQYPEGQTFDFEGEGQIALVRSYAVKESLTHQEFTFTDNPLKAGYRVRAVVYWTQNEDLYIAPGNDYEAGFHKPDDSVLISGIQETEKPTVAVKGSVREDAASIPFTLGGTIPTGTILLVKSYDAGTTEFTTTTGTLVGSTAALGTGETSISVASGSLSAGKKVVGYLLLSGELQAQSQPVTVAKAPEKEKPVAYLLTQKVTAGMTKVSASLRFDSSISSAGYKLYQFTGDTLDPSTAEVLNSGSLYRTTTNQTIYLGIGKLKAGSKLQLVLTAGGEEARSNVITVEPSPDWGTPYTAFSVSAVKSNAKTVPLSTDYSDEYLTMGDDFYCDVTVYACSGEYTDDEIEDKELWENYKACRTVAKANSRLGAATKGDLTLTFYETSNLKAGEKLFIKLRLPHTEWEGEEVDYVSASIPVIGADDEIPAYQVVLYNLDQDSSRGARLRSILADLNIPVQEMTYEHLNETVGYLAGLDDYEAAEGAYDGKEYTAEFMLLCNLPETLLDRFLDAMQDNGLRIDHKAVVTAYNQDSCYYELMDEIANEHDVFQMLLTLNSMVTDSKKLTEEANGSSKHWKAFQTALSDSDALLRSEEPTYEEMKAAYDALKAEYLAVTNLREITGEVAITISEEDGGTYTMTATVEEGLADAFYQYTWSNGQTTQTITGIPAERLIATTVSVTGEGLYGKLTAQLNVPSAVLPTVTAGSNALSVQLNAAGAGRNIPAATQYVVELYQGNTLVETKTVSTVQTVAFSGLSSGTAYTLKSYAVSPVGRSDILSQTVTTASGSSGGHTSSGGNSSRPSDPKPPVNDPSTGFTDVKNDAYYADAVKWAVDRGITNGQTTTLFGAEASCTRAQIVTFLWRAAGSPVPQTTKNPFTDLSEDAYYYQAVLWAMEQGITVGTTETTFDPDQTCTRGEAVTFLHRNAGEPVAAGNHGFQDVNGSDYYDNAVQWAKEKSITSGTTETTFSPSARCTRGQIVTFLYRNLGT